MTSFYDNYPRNLSEAINECILNQGNEPTISYYLHNSSAYLCLFCHTIQKTNLNLRGRMNNPLFVKPPRGSRNHHFIWFVANDVELVAYKIWFDRDLIVSSKYEHEIYTTISLETVPPSCGTTSPHESD